MPGREVRGGMAEIEIIVFAAFVVQDPGVPEAPEPGMGDAGMVQGEIQDQADAPGVAAVNQPLQVLQGAELRIDGIIILHVIPVIGRGGKDRRQPDPLDPQVRFRLRIPVVQVIQAVQNAGQVAGAVPVAVGEGPGEDFVEDQVPGVGRRGRSRGSVQRQGEQQKQGEQPVFHREERLL